MDSFVEEAAEMRIMVLGKWWNLKFVPTLGTPGNPKWGDCDHPTTRKKEIRILSRLRGRDKLDAIIHEMLHAADCHKTEDWVDTVATDIARELTRLGYSDSG